MPHQQLSLFASPPPAAFAPERELAAQLPPHVHLGTSSWTFPGWSGLVYPERTSLAELRRRGLALYTRYPLFGTVGVDRSYYNPLTPDELRDYATQLPAGFPCVLKVWNSLTTRFDPATGRPADTYLNRHVFEERVLGPLLEHFHDHVGVLIFEFPPGSGGPYVAPKAFVRDVHAFFRDLPRSVRYAVEVRNRQYLTPEYFACLRAHGVAHVLNHWERMPPLAVQAAMEGALPAPHVVCRWLLPPGTRYDDLVKAYDPFDRIRAPDPATRAALVTLARRCQNEQRSLFVLVDNKAEGSSPHSVKSLAEELASAFSTPRAG